MKLKLKNFRCYTEQEFDFGEEGLLLLSGSSGKGKSTLLMAVNFTLYGTGTKLITFGKTSCKVELHHQNYVIIRSKRPNVLSLYDSSTEETYEDDAAQSIINQHFGEAFEITAYVQQNAVNSFLLMGPTEKLNFLEKFVFQGVDIQSIKARSNAYIKLKNEELIAVNSQLELRSNDFEKLVKPVKVNFPIKTANKEISTKNEQTRLKNTKVLLKREEKTFETLNDELVKIKILDVMLSTYNQKLSENKEKLKLLSSKLSSIESSDFGENEDLLQQIIKYKEFLQKKERLTKDEEKLEEMKRNEKGMMMIEINKIKDVLWEDYSYNEAIEMVQTYEELLKDATALSLLNVKISKLNFTSTDEKVKNLENLKLELLKLNEKYSILKLQKEVYNCPGCKTCLRFENSLLVISKVQSNHEAKKDFDDVSSSIKSITSSISTLEKEVEKQQTINDKHCELTSEIKEIKVKYEDIPLLNEIKDSLDSMNEYIRDHNDMETSMKKYEKNIENSIFSSSINIMSKDIEKRRKTLSILSFIDVSREEEIRSVLAHESLKKDQIEELNNEINSLNKDNYNSEKILKTLKDNHNAVFSVIRSDPLLESLISESKKKIEEYKNNITNHEDTLKKIEEYNLYKTTIDTYNFKKKELEALKKEEKIKKDSYSSATLLKEKILKAESICVSNIVDSINTHAQEFLDIFFPNDPIVIRLLAFKETKKATKPQINIEIDYKGMDADISMLSGGELSRVVLAYTLALSEIFNAPMILLDECTSSIDQELTSIVVEGIKSSFPNKLIIVIAHQVVSGSFDREIKI